MSGINKVILIGRLGRDPEIRYTPDGIAVVNFSIATSEQWKDKNSGEKREKTEWHRIVVWRKLAELCNEYLSKGRQVYVEGKLQTRSWEDDNGTVKYQTEIVANQIQFLGTNNVQTNDDNYGESLQDASVPSKKEQSEKNNREDDNFDDLPF